MRDMRRVANIGLYLFEMAALIAVMTTLVWALRK